MATTSFSIFSSITMRTDDGGQKRHACRPYLSLGNLCESGSPGLYFSLATMYLCLARADRREGTRACLVVQSLA
eukprot:COSAG04_NODE_30023_length_265_cov_0.626506_2_plen_73_part_01